MRWNSPRAVLIELIKLVYSYRKRGRIKRNFFKRKLTILPLLLASVIFSSHFSILLTGWTFPLDPCWLRVWVLLLLLLLLQQHIHDHNCIHIYGQRFFILSLRLWLMKHWIATRFVGKSFIRKRIRLPFYNKVFLHNDFPSTLYTIESKFASHWLNFHSWIKTGSNDTSHRGGRFVTWSNLGIKKEGIWERINL